MATRLIRAMLPQKNTEVQNKHLWIHIMTSKKDGALLLLSNLRCTSAFPFEMHSPSVKKTFPRSSTWVYGFQIELTKFIDNNLVIVGMLVRYLLTILEFWAWSQNSICKKCETMKKSWSKTCEMRLICLIWLYALCSVD